MNLQAEEGTTEVSLENADYLIARHGLPLMLDFKANKKQCDYTVTVTWPNEVRFTFTGFAWGYGGTGPTGLGRFFDRIDCPLCPEFIPLDGYGKTDATWTRDAKPNDQVTINQHADEYDL